jgi:anti-sigma regulatory factor (Ser/Thr protein kinase)
MTTSAATRAPENATDGVLAFRLGTRALPLNSRLLARAASSIVADNLTDPELCYNIDLMLFEACANVVHHAYRGREPGELCIELKVAWNEHIHVRVLDWGPGFPEYPVAISNPPPEAERGRGLFIISQLADTLDIFREGEATVIDFTMQPRKNQWKPCA